MAREADITRKTKETYVSVSLNLDGKGKYNISTPVPFFNHMLELFAMHGLFDLTIKAKGDVDVDDHHLVEDVGIVLGEAFKKALGDRIGIRRYGSVSIPMDEALVNVDLDISGRPFLVYNLDLKAKFIKNFEVSLVEDFLLAFVNNAKITLHINEVYGRNTHHILEACFKGIARAINLAATLDARLAGPPSTKGILL